MPSDLSGITIGRYQLGDLLGQGAMGQVYRAEHTVLKNTVAIKRLDPKLAREERHRRNFLLEGQHAAGLSHQGIAAVYDVLEWEDECLLVMEFVQGRTLRDQKIPMDLKKFLDLAVDCAEALSAAHQHGIVHRDIKPSNIMLTRTGNQVKILDFGVAKRLPSSVEDATTQFEANESKSICGTLPYMAPEVLLGEDVDQRADLFSLGVVFYELATGRHPFREAVPMSTADRILHHQPPSLPQIRASLPPELDRIVQKMLAKDREDRYATTPDLAVDLRNLRRKERGHSTDEDDPVTRRRWLYGIATAGVSLALLLTVLFFHRALEKWFVESFYGLPKVKTVAIVPFQSTSNSPADRALAVGVSSELAGTLAELLHWNPSTGRSDGVHVIHQDHLPDFVISPEQEGEGSLAEQIAKESGATLILFGSLSRQNGGLDVKLRLHDGHRHVPGADSGRDILRFVSFTAPESDLTTLLTMCSRETLQMLGLAASYRSVQTDSLGTGDRHGIYGHFLRGVGFLFLAKRTGDGDLLRLATERIRLALTVDPRLARALTLLGESLLQQHRIDSSLKGEEHSGPSSVEKALENCGEAAQIDPTLAEAQLCLVDALMIDQQPDRALEHLKNASALRPGDERVVRSLIAVNRRLDLNWQTKTALESAIGREPDYWLYHFELGDYFYVADQYENAIQAFKKAAELAPDNWLPFRDLGIAYSRVARWEEGREALERSLELDPVNKDRRGNILSNLATAYFYSGRLPEAVVTYEKAIEESEREDSLRTSNLADALYFSSEKERAERLYNEAILLAQEELSADPRRLELCRRIGKAYAMLGQKDKAEEYLRKALELSAGSLDILAAAEIHQQFNETDLALEWLAKALEAGVHEAEIRNHPIFEPLENEARYRALFEHN